MIINKLSILGFKHITDSRPVQYNFYPHTIVSGENYAGKSTICEALCWVFCGCNINGNVTFDSLLLNNQSSAMAVEVEFTDNLESMHTLKREKSNIGKIILDGRQVSQNDLLGFIGDKDIFMSIFAVGHFQKFAPKEAREVLSRVLPQITSEQISSKLPPELVDYLPVSSYANSNNLLKECRARLKEIEKNELYYKGQLRALFESFKSAPSAISNGSEEILREKLSKLETKKVELLSLKIYMQQNSNLIAQRELLRKEYEHLKSKLITSAFKAGDTCPTCRQAITEDCLKHLDEHLKTVNLEVRSQIDEVVKRGKEISRQIESASNMAEASSTNEIHTGELANIESEMADLKQQLEAIAGVKAMSGLKEDASKKTTEINKILRELDEEKASLEKTIEAAKHCNAIRSELQFKSLSENLQKVSLRLEKLVKTTGEVKDCFEILYDGKELILLSNSERIRAFLEISNLINTKSGLALPVFIDNAESLTHYDKPDTQVFEAIVVRDKPLSVSQG